MEIIAALLYFFGLLPLFWLISTFGYGGTWAIFGTVIVVGLVIGRLTAPKPPRKRQSGEWDKGRRL